MILSFWGQGRFCLQLLLLGLSFGLLYDLFRTLRRLWRHPTFLIHCEDGLYWILLSLTMFFFLLKANGVQLRFFSVAAAFLGMGLYFGLLSAATQKALYFAGIAVKRLLKVLCNFLKIPLYIVRKVVLFPTYSLSVKIKKNAKKCLHFLWFYGKIRLRLVRSSSRFFQRKP